MACEAGYGRMGEDFFWFHKLGAPPHGGFGLGLGLGLTCVVMLFLGRASIKEAIFIQGGLGRLIP